MAEISMAMFAAMTPGERQALSIEQRMQVAVKHAERAAAEVASQKEHEERECTAWAAALWKAQEEQVMYTEEDLVDMADGCGP